MDMMSCPDAGDFRIPVLNTPPFAAVRFSWSCLSDSPSRRTIPTADVLEWVSVSVFQSHTYIPSQPLSAAKYSEL